MLRATDPQQHEGVAELSGVVRRVIAARVSDPHDVEDLVQETLVKVTAAEPRLGVDALQAYAIVTAQHVVIGQARKDGTKRRHIHRMVDYTSLDGPEELTLQREETDALAVALSRLDERDRQMLMAHEVEGVDTASLARDSGTSPGNVAARLARARARLRLEFLLAFRGVTLPEGKCRSVLLALSSGDQRRQRALRAGDHLLVCPTCAALSEPLVERRRSIAGFIPLVGLGVVRAGKAVGRAAHSGTAQAVAGVSAVAAGAVVVVALTQPGASPTPVPPTTVAAPITSPLMSGTESLLPLPPGGLAPLVGRPVQAQSVLVLAVPSDEGAWIGTSAQSKVWLRFVGSGESPFKVVAGQHLTFTGSIGANSPAFAASGLSAGDLSSVTAQGAHIEVTYTALRIT
jgi:RNA polymerase sigma factor (sigma-70 family)